MPEKSSHYGAGGVIPKGNTWLGRFSVEGQPQKVSLGRRREVDPKGLTQAQARKKLRDYQANFKLPRPGADTLFAEAAAAFIARKALMGLTEKTIYDYKGAIKNHFNPVFGNRPIGSIKPAEVDELQQRLLRKLSKKSVRIYMSVLKGIFSFAADPAKGNMIDADPAANVERPKPDKDAEITVLFSAELEAVIAEIPADDLGEVERRLYPFSAKEGLRQAESTKRLRWRHLDFEGRNIPVYETKSGKNRVVPMASDVAEILLEWRTITPWNKDDDLVFAHPATGEAIDASTLLRRFQKCCIRANVGDFHFDHEREGKVYAKWPKTTFHDLRHSFGTSCAMAGVPLPKLQKWMGHARIETTMIYVNFVPSEDEADVLDRALGNRVESVPLS